MKKLVIVILALISAFPLLADDPSIEGKYQCVGRNEDGSNYQGQVAIEKRGEVYSLRWTIGGSQHEGIGIFENGVLSVSWQMPNVGPGGVVVYKPGKKGSLLGRWVAFNERKINEEVLMPLK